MSNFSKETKEFISAVGGERSKVLASIPPSADRMIAGEILVFRYHLGVGQGSKAQRVCLIVRCRRGNGVYEGRSGKLVSCFKLNGNSETVVDIIIENLYKRRRKSSYYGKIKDSLIALLGIDSYRTYKLQQMKGIYKVQLRNSDGFKSRR
tara:strand:+ start:1128 stop:1577 length:450 start_codon:yes stop_codon:yes gene_type:complete